MQVAHGSQESTNDAFAPDRADFYLGDPHAVFRRLRRDDPVCWYEGSGGVWCLLKHADIEAVSRQPRLFTSTQGIQIGMNDNIRPEGVPPTILEMDPPEHNRHRKLVIRAFTPRAAAAMEPAVRRIARDCLGTVAAGEIVDFADAVAVPVPMYVIADMLGVPHSDRPLFKRWSDSLIAAGGGNRNAETDAQLGELFAYFAAVLEERRRSPGPDLVSTLAEAEIDGTRLSDPEILIFCTTLLAAGNETTRNLIAGGALLLARHPEALRSLRERPSLIANAVEEMLRWWTPVRSFIRVATEDTELRGRAIRAGQTLLLLYGSANRDEEVWGDDSDSFDISRDHIRRRHLAFGFGQHLCLGATLARLEARVVFEEILARFNGLELAGEPEILPSRLMHGVEHLPLVFAE